jgi:hypothetical protein
MVIFLSFMFMLWVYDDDAHSSGAAKRLQIKSNYELRACISNISALLQGTVLSHSEMKLVIL